MEFFLTVEKSNYLLCFEGTIIFCSRLKIYRKISLKKVTLKSGCLNCNVRNTLSSTHHTFKVLRANQSIFLLGTKGTLKILSRYVWTPLMNILTSKLGFKILILVSERIVHNMESPLSRSPCITRSWYIWAIVPHLGYITAHDRSMVQVSGTTEGGKNTASFLFH